MSTATAPSPVAAPGPGGAGGASAVPAGRDRGARGKGTVWIVVGLALLLLPVVLTLYRDHQLARAAQDYAAAVEDIRPDARAEEYLAQARAYNARLAASGHHALPAVEGAPGLSDYLATLDAPETQGVMARLVVPSIGVDLPVRHTTNDAVLYDGAGHMFGTDLPVGGEGTTSVISAHTGMVDASMFDNLPLLRDGAAVYVSVMGRTLHYEVRSREVVGPEETDAITYEDGVDKLVLLTCTPYGLNTDRLLVEAVRVLPDGEAPPARSLPNLSWWMVADLAVIAGVLVHLLVRRRRERSRTRRQREERPPRERLPRA